MTTIFEVRHKDFKNTKWKSDYFFDFDTASLYFEKTKYASYIAQLFECKGSQGLIQPTKKIDIQINSNFKQQKPC